jgi:Nucleotidyl transferase AbiEii toxin, Type IV TA system
VTRPFLHDDPEFEPLIRIVADERHLSEGIIEKDYWVTHSLWALQRRKLGLIFKGGTSLSKAFGLIQRFSEDVDLTIDRGECTDLPALGSLTSKTKGATTKRRAFFEALTATLDIPGSTVVRLVPPDDGRWISVEQQVEYQRRFDLPAYIRPFVRLEPGVRRWKPPAIERSLTSFLHEHVARIDLMDGYLDNRPIALPCIHPFVTLVDKLDAIGKRYARPDFAPETFVRHYEDAAHVISRLGSLPPLTDPEQAEVIRECAAGPLLPNNPAFVVDDVKRREMLETAHAEIAPMFWGERLSLTECCGAIRTWLDDRRFS